jgi:hypothetical protein
MHALLSDVFLWRARFSNCADARVINPRFDAVPVHAGSPDQPVMASTPDATEDFVERIVAAVEDSQKAVVRKRMRDGLIADIDKDQLATMERDWRKCAASFEEIPGAVYLRQHADFLSRLGCVIGQMDGQRTLSGLVRIWFSDVPMMHNVGSAADRLDHASRLARGLLGLNREKCEATEKLSPEDRERLLGIATTPAPPPR